MRTERVEYVQYWIARLDRGSDTWEPILPFGSLYFYDDIDDMWMALRTFVKTEPRNLFRPMCRTTIDEVISAPANAGEGE